MKAFLKNYRQSPRKVRLVADMVRGKSVERARRTLAFGEKKSAPALAKLLDSAVANARAQGHAADDLFVKELMVDAGIVMRRMEPKARGQGAIIRHRTSRVTLTLGEMHKKVNGGKHVAEGEQKAAKPAARKSAVKRPSQSQGSTEASKPNVKASAKKTAAKKAAPTT